MRIGLVDIDGRKKQNGERFPNLALMKLSSYWKEVQGATVEWADQFHHYDVVYMAKVFTFSEDDHSVYQADQIVKAGTGYMNHENVDWNRTLRDEIEHIFPDYGLYGITDYTMGFVTRGCVNKCSFCVVPDKEGDIRPHSTIYELMNGNNDIILMDNNILAHDHGLDQIDVAVKLGLRIDANQGLDCRIAAANPYILDLLAHVRWRNYIRFACDHKSQMEPLKKCIDTIRRLSGKKTDVFVYVLITEDYDDSLYRLNFCRNMSRVFPHAQPYIDLKNPDTPPRWQKDMARWANNRAVFRSTTFEGYRGSIHKKHEHESQGRLF